MDTDFFYWPKTRSTRLCTTLGEAQLEAHACENPTGIIVLPPRAGDQLVDSDTEDIPEGLQDDFKPAGKLEVEFEDSEEDLSDSSANLNQPGTSKRRKVSSQPKWREKDNLIT